MSFRLDGHPVWSRDYKKVSLQAAPLGKRQLFIVDLEAISSTPRNHNLLLLNALRARDLGVAPGAVVDGEIDGHG